MTARDQTNLNQQVSQPIVDKTTQDYHFNSSFCNSQQIKSVMGYPVIKPIFDQNGDMILNVGDLITYHAIQRAQEAGVLDLVLKAVYWGGS